ncbi:3321_t:CDS:1, partial [Racocetra fulgida]
MAGSSVDRRLLNASSDGGVRIANGNGDEKKVLGMLSGAGYNINQIIGS